MDYKAILKEWGEIIEKAKKNYSKLVPVKKQITRGGKQITTTVYVNPEKEKKSEKTKKEQPEKVNKVNIQQHLRPIRKALGTQRYKEYLLANGITWERAEHGGADTMRASMAAKKWLEAGNKLDEGLYQHMLKGGSPSDYKKPIGVSDELRKIAEESGDGFDLFTNASENPKVLKELKELVKQTEGKSTKEKLDKIFSDLDGGKNFSEYAKTNNKDPLDFKLGEEVFKNVEYSIIGAREGSLEDNGGGKAIAKTIYISPNILQMDDYKLALKVMVHEFAHTVSNRFPELERHINSNPSGIFGKTNRKKHIFEPSIHKDLRIGSIDNFANPEEVWADAVAFYLTEPNTLKQKNPDIYKFVDKALQQVPNLEDDLRFAIKEFKKLRNNPMDASNYEELKEHAKQNKLRIRLDDIKLDSAKEIVKTYAKVREKIKFLKDEPLYVYNESPFSPRGYMRKNYYAYAYNSNVVVNTDRYNNLERLEKTYNKDIEKKWHPEGTNYRSIVTHELGHVVHNELGERLKEKTTNITKRIKSKVLKNLNLKPDDVADGLSVYATVNTKEFFAEAFAEWIDSENPRPIAKEFGKVLMEELKKIDA